MALSAAVPAAGAAATDGRRAEVSRLVSVASDGTAGNNFSRFPAISDGGRFVAYESSASNLVPGDTNAASDVFVWDRAQRTTTLVSAPLSAPQAYRGSFGASITGDGRYVAFWSEASNLVLGDTNGKPDVFVLDRTTETIALISRNEAGEPGDRQSWDPAISHDGRYVAFTSEATNLAPSGRKADIFVTDQTTGAVEVVSDGVDGAGADGPSAAASISADGRFIAFSSLATNLIADDQNGAEDVFVLDRMTAATTLASSTANGQPGDGPSKEPSISADGQHVAFSSWATDLVAEDGNGLSDIFVRDLGGFTELASTTATAGANGMSDQPAISANGRYVAFWTGASNLVPGDDNGLNDVVVFDSKRETTTLVSAASDGTSGAGASYTPALTTDGRFVAYFSWAEDLVRGDVNRTADVLLLRLR